jgi:hypothetical protein
MNVMAAEQANRQSTGQRPVMPGCLAKCHSSLPCCSLGSRGCVTHGNALCCLSPVSSEHRQMRAYHKMVCALWLQAALETGQTAAAQIAAAASPSHSAL